MASPNTIKLMQERAAARANRVTYLTRFTGGQNREGRRKDKIGWRLRSKMRPDRWKQVYNWKYPKKQKV